VDPNLLGSGFGYRIWLKKKAKNDTQKRYFMFFKIRVFSVKTYRLLQELGHF
jgi:hypothetical protein